MRNLDAYVSCRVKNIYSFFGKIKKYNYFKKDVFFKIRGLFYKNKSVRYKLRRKLKYFGNCLLLKKKVVRSRSKVIKKINKMLIFLQMKKKKKLMKYMSRLHFLEFQNRKRILVFKFLNLKKKRVRFFLKKIKNLKLRKKKMNYNRTHFYKFQPVKVKNCFLKILYRKSHNRFFLRKFNSVLNKKLDKSFGNVFKK